MCFSIEVEDIALPATGAHIHVGAAGSDGAAVVFLVAPASTGMSSGCVSGNTEVLKQIVANPAGYYVNVHNADFPDGAVRGQLSTSPK